MFNAAIAAMALREVARTGARFTWTNKQLAPVRSVLDRVFMSPEWEMGYPLCALVAETRIGSDHVPLVYSSGEDRLRRSPRFFFETAWFEVPGFESLFKEKWLACVQQVGPQRGPMEFWNAVGGRLRASLKGWGANLGRMDKEHRTLITAEIARIDAQADARVFSEQEWAHRYALEGQVEAILRAEEEYWRRRSGLKWTLKGDANTKYFQAYANGRHRKCAILRLQSEQGLLLRQEDISRHIYEFYINLMGTSEAQGAGLREDVWEGSQRVLETENDELGLAFLPEEIDAALMGMKVDTAPGPDGWPVAMFKRFWPTLREPIFEICNGFMRGQVDISRLNFGVLSLIPKVQGADNIRQYRPIALINVPFKICAKACATRLGPIAHRTIQRNQSAFIRGRNILEGPLALQEIVHELKRTKEPAVLLKLDFEKAYDRVNWDFLRQVLLGRGFSAVWVHRVLQLVSGGQTAVSVNGEIGHFFRNKRGLRQGDPMSPLLFNFVVDALSAMLSKAAAAGHIQGLVGHLIPGGVTHLHVGNMP